MIKNAFRENKSTTAEKLEHKKFLSEEKRKSRKAVRRIQTKAIIA